MNEQREILEQSVEKIADQRRPDERNEASVTSQPASYPQARGNTPISPQMGRGAAVVTARARFKGRMEAKVWI